MRKMKIVIIGAGAAGSYAGYLLNQLGHKVTILEARDRVGGRTCSMDDIDIGGSWVSTTQPIVYKLCQEFQLTLIPQYEAGNTLYDLNQHKEVLSGDIGAMGNPMLEEILAKFEQWSENIDFNSAFYQELDNISVDAWLDYNVTDQESNNFIRRFISGIATTPANKLSMLFWLFFLNQGHGFKCLAGTQGGAQEFRIKEGTQTISKILTKNLDIRLEQQVIKVLRLENKQYCVLSKAGEEFYADKVICAIPPNLINKIEWVPQLEEERNRLYSGMTMGCVTKLVIKYAKPLWREQGFSGTCISDSGTFMVTFDGCGDNYAALIVFVVPDFTQTDHGNYPNELILNRIAELYQIPELAQPLQIYRKDWFLDEFAAGCYFCSPRIGDGGLYKYLAKSYNDIYFIGTETANDWYGYIEGALESADRVVKQITNT